MVNPWALPLQKPYPHIWIPGVASKETVVWAAQHGYPYIGLGTNFELSQKIWALYQEAAEVVGYKAGPEQFGQLLSCHVQEVEAALWPIQEHRPPCPHCSPQGDQRRYAKRAGAPERVRRRSSAVSSSV